MTDQVEPRVVVDYAGVQILDARDRIRIVVTGEIPTGLKAGLRSIGFKPWGNSHAIWQAPNNPKNIMHAQAIATEFFGEAP